MICEKTLPVENTLEIEIYLLTLVKFDPAVITVM